MYHGVVAQVHRGTFNRVHHGTFTQVYRGAFFSHKVLVISRIGYYFALIILTVHFTSSEVHES